MESGRPEIVDKLLEMGADPNQRGNADEQTPLNVCLKLIQAVKNPDAWVKAQREHPKTPALLDVLRRFSNGLTGATLEQNEQFYESAKNMLAIEDFVINELSKKISSRLDLELLRYIAVRLISAGANVNAEHNSPIKGYTPVMLAAESNESDLFKIMLEKGGNPKASYSSNGRSVNCFDIAQFFQSQDVLNLLRKRR